VKLCGKKTPLVTVGRRRRRTVHHRQESQGGGHSHKKKNAPSLLQFGRRCFHLNFKAALPLTVHIPHTATTMSLLFHFSVRENSKTYLLLSFLFCKYLILSIFQPPQGTHSDTHRRLSQWFHHLSSY
jgi:hypothetical protein